MQVHVAGALARVGVLIAFSCLYRAHLFAFRDWAHALMAVLRILLGDDGGASLYGS